MALDFRTRTTLVLTKPSAVDPDSKRVITQDAILRLPNGKLVTVFEGTEEEFFREAEIGHVFSVILFLAAGDRSIVRLALPNQFFSQSGFRIMATAQGRVVEIEHDTPERYRVWIDAGDCHVYFFTSHELKVDDFIRAEGRLEVREKREVERSSELSDAAVQRQRSRAD